MNIITCEDNKEVISIKNINETKENSLIDQDLKILFKDDNKQTNGIQSEVVDIKV